MKEEFSSLQKSNTWELVQCKWVYKTKFAADGSPLNYKAILVAKGYSHVHGIDYNETFVPVAKMDSIRLALAIATSKQWEIHHMDVKCVFLNGYLTEDIYMQQRQGFFPIPYFVCRLKKSLYGLKQAPRAWYAKIDSFLLSLNCVRCK